MQRKVFWSVNILLVGLIAVTAFLYLNRKQSFHGSVINPPAPMPDIKLTDQNGQPFQLTDLRGKVVFLYFGYTNCPDECPLTMAHVKQAVDQLGTQSEDVRVVMVTTDPARDTQQALKSWLAKFNPNFIGLWGTPEELAKTWKDYGVTVDDGGETHSYFLYVIDQSGNLRETFLPDSQAADEAADAQLLLSQNTQ